MWIILFHKGEHKAQKNWEYYHFHWKSQMEYTYEMDNNRKADFFSTSTKDILYEVLDLHFNIIIESLQDARK